MQRSVPSIRRRLTWVPALATAVVAGALAGCSSSPQASTTTQQTSTTPAPATSSSRPGTTSTPATTTTELDLFTDQSVEGVWYASIDAFYVASEHDEPAYAPLFTTLVQGGPVAEHTLAYLTDQKAVGVAGPSTWRIGNEHVVNIQPETQSAVIDGCSYDPGSHYISSGATAPADLGGGPGYTGYISTLEVVNNSWQVDSTITSAPSTTSEAGPCHGF